MTGTLDSVRTATTAEDATRPAGVAATARSRLGLLALLVVPLAAAVVASVALGSGGIPLAEVWRALTVGGNDTTTVLIREFRLPRTVLGIAVGVALGLGGALMQAVTRNPLAEPGLLGVNAGAFLAIVVAIATAGAADIRAYVWWSFLGAALAAVVVYAIGSRGRAGATPVRLVLAGVALNAVLSGIAYSFTLLNPDIFDKIRFWQSGSLQNRGWDVVAGVLPFLVVGALLALALPRALNALSLGDDLAVSLGARVGLTRAGGVLGITLLCGAATAAAGPIAFLGLLAPYLARAIVGPDQRWIMPFTLVLAPTVMLAADVAGRFVVASEMPVGVVSSFLGAPVLIALVRAGKAKAL
ncbi:iron chelate uptake ABC transporter family permease subunit [Herbiconiux sp. SYSU D00978]|uniref:iron chelate uptake ABC transporter family permease subunit n=1 Tax=Herbiconiux sp. SYSU D00978 TaxID=2812562 RepID=UPI001A965836|nr:iron chelate uptake ABC transporter family permease subunit [Herbiconiux sp. SYSU D00978]